MLGLAAGVNDYTQRVGDILIASAIINIEQRFERASDDRHIIDYLSYTMDSSI